MPSIVLASASPIRATLLRNAGLQIDVSPARVDEAGLRDGLAAEQASPRDTADILAEAKARRVGDRHPEALVIGCDQVLSIEGQILSKPVTIAEARAQLEMLRGKTHNLASAAVIFEDGRPVWRHVGVARLTMRDASDGYIDGYLDRNRDAALSSVGAYRLEEEGVRLFSTISGDFFTILGLPLLEILGYLSTRGVIDG